MSVYLSIYLSIYLAILLSYYLLSISVSVSISVSLSLSLSIACSVYLPTYVATQLASWLAVCPPFYRYAGRCTRMSSQPGSRCFSLWLRLATSSLGAAPPVRRLRGSALQMRAKSGFEICGFEDARDAYASTGRLSTHAKLQQVQREQCLCRILSTSHHCMLGCCCHVLLIRHSEQLPL